MPEDKLLADQVEAELKWDPRIDARRFGVAVHDGTVTLSGIASSYSQKWAALQAAERVHGVQAVADEIKVRVPDAYAQDDIAIAQAIEHYFRSHVDVPTTVKAEVRNGVVTLTGEADWHYQRSEAERAVRHIRGVRDLVLRVNVKQDIEQRVSDALKRSADLDAQSITITMDDGTVHLHGQVHSLHEKEAAKHAALAAPGVIHVDNQIAVRP